MKEMKKFDVFKMKKVTNNKKKNHIGDPKFFLDKLRIIYSSWQTRFDSLKVANLSFEP